MEKKLDIVRKHVSKGEYKKALMIAKKFKLGITREQHEVMTRAYECMTNERFYLSLNVDTAQAISNGIKVISSIYG